MERSSYHGSNSARRAAAASLVVGVGVLVGGTGVAVEVGKGVLVGGTEVGVFVGGTGVTVGDGVFVGGTGVTVGVGDGVLVGTGVLVGGTGVAVGVFVGGIGVAVGGGVGVGSGAGAASGGGSSGAAVGVGGTGSSPQAIDAAAMPTANRHAQRMDGHLDAVLPRLIAFGLCRNPSSGYCTICGALGFRRCPIYAGRFP